MKESLKMAKRTVKLSLSLLSGLFVLLLAGVALLATEALTTNSR